MLRRKCSFSKAIFLILAVRNHKTSSGIDSKTSDCLSRICLYHHDFELSFCY